MRATGFILVVLVFLGIVELYVPFATPLTTLWNTLDAALTDGLEALPKEVLVVEP
jgi:hypothetical protein